MNCSGTYLLHFSDNIPYRLPVYCIAIVYAPINTINIVYPIFTFLSNQITIHHGKKYRAKQAE
jgi:hypothetical protein